AIVEACNDAVIAKDLDGIITGWNPGAERLYGWTAAEVLGRPISLLIPPEHPDELPAIMAKLKRGERIADYEAVRVRKDGRRVDISLSISPIKDASGTVVGASAIARDITERVRQGRRQRALADAALKISASLSLAETLQAVLQVLTDQAREIIGA